jgi:hypothetical protein
VVLSALSVVVLFLCGTRAQSPAAAEYQVNAAFFYNFAKFVEWLPSNFSDVSAPLQICVFSRDPFGEELHDHHQGKDSERAQTRDPSGARSAGGRPCHILFIASLETGQLRKSFESLRGFVERGGMINFVLENNRVLFEVNLKAAQQRGLKISSELLNVAKLVVV